MKFRIDIPPEQLEQISQTVESVGLRIDDNELPEYHQFVTNLFKDGAKASEELHHATTGISGEAGEILDLSKKVWVYEKPLDIFHLLEELGDLRFYYQAVLNMLRLTDADIVALNMNKLAKRYASGKYSNEQANARADKAEGRKFIGSDPVSSNRSAEGATVPEDGLPIG